MSEIFVCLNQPVNSHKDVTHWLNSLTGKDTTFLLPYYYGDGLPVDRIVERIIDWQLVQRIDGVFVAIARIEVK